MTTKRPYKTQEVPAASWEEFVSLVKPLAKERGETLSSLFGLKAIAGSKNGYTHTKYVWKQAGK